jgi:hypothetical protein
MTVSRYSIVRYVPDSLREEFINIGVVVAAEDGSFSGSRFLDQWSRAKKIAGQDVSFLKDVALEIGRMADEQSGFLKREPFSVDRLQQLAADWQNAVQFSPPRPSVAPDPAKLLAQLFSQYVGPRGTSTTKARDKRTVVRAAREQLSAALANHFPVGAPAVITDDAIPGQIEPHRFDLVVRNGKPLLGLDGLSFEVSKSRDLDNEVSAIAWSLLDVRNADTSLPLGVLVIPPLRPREDYQRAQRLCADLKVTLIPESEVNTWIEQAVASLPVHSTSG